MSRPKFPGELGKKDRFIIESRNKALEIMKKPSKEWTPSERLQMIGIVATRIREEWITKQRYAYPGTPTAETICCIVFDSAEELDKNLDGFMSFLEKEEKQKIE